MKLLKAFLKKAISTRALPSVITGKRFIFVYHDISGPEAPHYSSHYSTSVSDFKKQIDLIDSLFHLLPLDQLVSKKRLSNNRNYASITFDDGFKSVLDNAHPILKQRKIPYTLFLNKSAVEDNQIWVTNVLFSDEAYRRKILKLASSAHVEGESLTSLISNGYFKKSFTDGYKMPSPDQNIYLNTKDVSKLLAEGVSIASHSTDHLVLGACDTSTLQQQIVENKDYLMGLSHTPPTHFAIPFGKKEHFDIQTVAAIKSFGYQYIYTTNPNCFSWKDITTDGFLFPRIGIIDQSPEELLFYINRALLKKYDL